MIKILHRNSLSAITALCLSMFLLQGCGNKVDCNSSKTKDSVMEKIQSNLAAAVWYQELGNSLTGKPELTNIKTISRNDELKQAQCSATYSITYNGKARDLEVDYGLSYLQDKGETDVAVESGVISRFVALVMMESPRITLTPEQQAANEKLVAEQKLAATKASEEAEAAKAAEKNANEAYAARCISAMSKSDELASIRYKTYGLKELDSDKVKALQKVEDATARRLTFTKDNIDSPSWSAQDVLAETGANFGVGANRAYAWQAWFNGRFFPVYLNYAKAICAAVEKQYSIDSTTVVKPQEQLDIAKAIYTAKTADNHSVWKNDSAPWQDYVLNDDVGSVDSYVQALKDKARSGQTASK